MTKRDVNVNELPRFSDIDNFLLMSMNRGAILANIYEDYSGSSPDLLPALENYMLGFTELEKDIVGKFMLIHLKQRGYTIDS